MIGFTNLILTEMDAGLASIHLASKNTQAMACNELLSVNILREKKELSKISQYEQCFFIIKWRKMFDNNALFELKRPSLKSINTPTDTNFRIVLWQ